MRFPVLCQAVLLLAFAPGTAGAQTVYKCVVKGKPTSFQNEPCPAGQKTAKAVSYTPETVAPYRPDVQARPYARRSDNQQMALMPISTKPSACEMARSHRDRVLGKNNQGGNYDVRVSLNDAVQRACN